jgi:hypothetical protein
VEPGSGVTRTQELMPQQRMLLELARNFAAIEDRGRQEELCALARAYAEHDGPDQKPRIVSTRRVSSHPLNSWPS